MRMNIRIMMTHGIAFLLEFAGKKKPGCNFANIYLEDRVPMLCSLLNPGTRWTIQKKVSFQYASVCLPRFETAMFTFPLIKAGCRPEQLNLPTAVALDSGAPQSPNRVVDVRRLSWGFHGNSIGIIGMRWNECHDRNTIIGNNGDSTGYVLVCDSAIYFMLMDVDWL